MRYVAVKGQSYPLRHPSLQKQMNGFGLIEELEPEALL